MRRRDQAGDKAIKATRRKALKRRNAPKTVRHRNPAATTKDVARLTREREEALEQQTATSEVLSIIRRSPADAQPVFDAIVQSAARLCGGIFSAVYLYDDDLLRIAATNNFSPQATRQILDFREQRRPDRSHLAGRAILDRAITHVHDVLADPEYSREWALAGGWRAVLAVPLLRNGNPVGALSVAKAEPIPFSDQQVQLLKTFADQAVIAIENVRLFEAERKRMRELSEALEQQTATSEVLEIISSSPGELEPVFKTILQNATRICAASFGNLYLHNEGYIYLVASHNVPPAFANVRRGRREYPAESALGKVIRTKECARVDDLATMRPYIERDKWVVEAVELGGVRSSVAVPLIKEKQLVGIIAIYRQEVLPFTDKQVELVKNFAAQAVIAIENARLLSELRESLQQQTATADVLKVISRSTFDLQTVLDTLVESAARLCGAEMANIWRPRDGAYRLTASYGVTARYKESLENKEFLNTIAIEPGRGTTVGRVLLERKSVHIHDIQADPDYKLSGLVALGGTRTMLGIPMLREGDPIGVLVLVQSAVRPFTDKQIELATTFADQAVIAIENVRLFEEVQARTRDLSELLEQQTATSEVLQVISSSAGELKPVFETMLESAVRICGAKFGNLLLVEGDAFRHVALHGVPQAYLEERRREPVIRPRPGSDLDRIRSTKQIVHVADMQLEGPATAAIVELAGARTFLNVPMLKDNELIGTIGIYRQEVRPFTNKQIALLTSFAAQAVIAIENARLLNDLNKLNQQLEQRVADQVSEIERMGKLRRFLPPQVADLIVASGTEKQLESHRREITALFCDLRGFTGFSESSDPEDVMALLRDYHAAIGGIINKYGGTLERYAGDGVMVVFNDPIPVDNPALQAVLMAIDMRGAIGDMIEKRRKLGHDIGFGIGIAHGFATLGTIGFEGRFDYAAIGTVSNVASRLCDEAKPGQILISPRVLMAVEGAISVEPVGEFKLKGISRPLTAYNVLSAVSAKI